MAGVPIRGASPFHVDVGCVDRSGTRLSDDEIKQLIETKYGNASAASTTILKSIKLRCPKGAGVNRTEQVNGLPLDTDATAAASSAPQIKTCDVKCVG